MGKRWRTRITASMGVCVAAVLLTGCLPPGIACPAIGYTSGVQVQVDGDVAFVDACAGSECDAPSDLPTVVIFEGDAGTWTVEFPISPPDELTLRAYGTGGVLLAEEVFELVWTQVDPGPCPGPVTTPTLEFVVG